MLLLATVTSTAAALDPCPPRSSTCLNYYGGPVIQNPDVRPGPLWIGDLPEFRQHHRRLYSERFPYGNWRVSVLSMAHRVQHYYPKDRQRGLCQLSLDHAFPVERRCDHHRRVNSGRDLGADQLRAFAGAQQQPDLHNIFSKRQNNQPRQILLAVPTEVSASITVFSRRTIRMFIMLCCRTCRQVPDATRVAAQARHSATRRASCRMHCSQPSPTPRLGWRRRGPTKKTGRSVIFAFLEQTNIIGTNNTSYTVQKGWSNELQQCIAHK